MVQLVITTLMRLNYLVVPNYAILTGQGPLR